MARQTRNGARQANPNEPQDGTGFRPGSLEDRLVRIARKIPATVREILGSDEVEVVPQSDRSFLAGLKLFEDRSDKGYSMTRTVSQCGRWKGVASTGF